MTHLYTTVELVDYDLDEDVKDRIYSEYELVATDPVIYIHVHQLDNQLKTHPKDLYCMYGESENPPDIADFDTEEDWYRALEESVHEYLRCNHKV